jgi:hypothetical protein
MECYQFIKGIDFFGKLPEIYINGNPKQVTFMGRMFTFIFMFIYILIIGYKLYRMIQREDITFYDSFTNTEELPSIQITNENFYFAFAVLNKEGKPFIDETIYYPKAYYTDGETEEINLERCHIDKIGKRYKTLFSNYELNNYYCLSNVNYIFKAYENSINIKLFPCKNRTENNNHCGPKEIIDSHINGRDIQFFFEDILITPFNYSNPIKERINTLYTTLYKNFGQYLYTEMQIVKIETYTNIIGFDFLTNPKVQEFLKYDSLEIIPQPGYDLDDEENNYTICEVVFQLNDKVLKEKRQYIKLIDVLGEVGGFMEFIFSSLRIICNFIGNFIYEKSIVNNLFSFDIRRKVIILKPEKNNESRISEEQNKDKNKIFRKQMSSTINARRNNHPKGRNIFIDNIKEIGDKNSENYLIDKKNILETNTYKENKVSEKTQKISKKKLYINSIKYSNTLNCNKNKGNSFNSIFDEDKNFIIDKISLKKLLISKCFCFSKYKKNVYKILLKESMDIISQKLDVFNIFRILFVVETNKHNFDINMDNIRISDGGVKNL